MASGLVNACIAWLHKLQSAETAVSEQEPLFEHFQCIVILAGRVSDTSILTRNRTEFHVWSKISCQYRYAVCCGKQQQAARNLAETAVSEQEPLFEHFQCIVILAGRVSDTSILTRNRTEFHIWSKISCQNRYAVCCGKQQQAARNLAETAVSEQEPLFEHFQCIVILAGRVSDTSILTRNRTECHVWRKTSCQYRYAVCCGKQQQAARNLAETTVSEQEPLFEHFQCIVILAGRVSDTSILTRNRTECHVWR